MSKNITFIDLKMIVEEGLPKLQTNADKILESLIELSFNQISVHMNSSSDELHSSQLLRLLLFHPRLFIQPYLGLFDVTYCHL